MKEFSEKEFIQRLLDFKQNSSDFIHWKEAQSKCRRSVISLYIGLVVCVMGLMAYYIGAGDVVGAFTEDCLVKNVEILQDVFRPPVTDCDFCQIEKIPTLSNISEDMFYQKFAYTGIPLLVEDGMRDWDTKDFTYQYFKKLYSNVNLNYQDKAGCQFLGYDSGLSDLEDLFNMSEARATHQAGTVPWYIGWSNCIPSVSNELRQHYKTPYFMGNTERTRHDWIFMGSPSYTGAPLHIDAVDYASWQAQIRGRKSWRFEPPSECWFHCPHQHNVQVRPGNIFVFNSNLWYHETTILAGQDSLTIGAEYD